MNLNNYPNLTLAIDDFQKRGFQRTFHLEDGSLKCYQNGKKYTSKELRIVEYHRFVGDKTYAKKSIIFGVKCNDGEKGYTISSDENMSSLKLLEFMDKVKIKTRKEIKISNKKIAS